MSSRNDFDIDEVFDGYRIETVLGKGGMGVVYKAENIELGRPVALKVIAPQFSKNESFVRRFRREARSLAMSFHPNIVLVYTFRQTEQGLYLAMEYVEGESLAERLKASGPLTWEQALPYMKQLLAALKYAHGRGIIHRDIKPNNIMLSTEDRVKVMDFGLAKSLQEDETNLTVTGQQAGTLCYMSPEQIKGLAHTDHRSDLFSAGMTCYEMLTGRLPFDKKGSAFTIQRAIVEDKFPDLRAFEKVVPRRLSQIVMKALEKSPDKRYQDAGEMLADLEAFEAQASKKSAVTTFTHSVSSTVAPLKLRKRKGVAAMMAGLVLLITLASGYAYNLGLFSSSGTPYTERFNNSLIPPGTDRAATESTLLPTAEEDTSAHTASEKSPDSVPSLPVDDPEEAAIAQAPATGTLTVRSDPRGAQVRIDGRPWGQTPRNAQELEPGRYQVTIERQGYEPLTEAVTIEAGGSVTVNRKLAPLKGTLQILARPWGDIYVDGDLVQQGADFRQTVEVPAGTRRVRVVNAARGEWERIVTVPAGGSENVTVDFVKEIPLTIASPVATGEIFIDGQTTGVWTPGVVQVPVGRRRVEVRAEGFEMAEGPVTLMVDEATQKRVAIELTAQ